MADPVFVPTAPPTPAPTATEPAPAPTPAPAPVSSTVAAPAKEAAPAVSPTLPVSEAPKPAEPAPPAASVPTLLEDFDAAAAAKAKPPETPAAVTGATGATGAVAAAPAAPGVTSAAVGATAAVSPPTVPAAPAAVEYKYTVPETIKMDDALKGKVHKAFDDFRANPSEGAQGLIGLHEEQMRAYAQHIADEQQRIFRETRQQWRKDTLGDQELGGAGHQTAMGAVARMRDLLVPEKNRPAFEQMLRVTGVGDHPEFLRLLHQAARFYDEPAMPSVNPRPPPNNGQRPSRRLRDIYDHPRSSADGRS